MPDTRRIALALNVVDPHPNHQDVFAGVLDYARERGDWACFIDEHPMMQIKQRTKARGGYDGVIARAHPAMQKRGKTHGIPIVNTVYQYHRPGVAGVYPNPRSWSAAAAEHLIGRGFQRFVLFYDPASRYGKEMFEDFGARLNQQELDYQVHHFAHGATEESAHWIGMEKAVLKMIDGLKPPVAVFIDSAIMARMIVELCEHRGLHVPQDVAVLSHRNPSRLLETPVSISAIEDDYRRIGYESAKLLDALMAGGAVPTEPIFIETPGIAARASTDYFSVDDRLVSEALQYISKHLGEKLYVEDIADALNVSVVTLYKRFEAALGRTLGDEIRRLRVAAVRVMLADLDLGLKQIAQRAGFGSTDALNRSFKAAFGLTPGAYRKREYEEKK